MNTHYVVQGTKLSTIWYGSFIEVVEGLYQDILAKERRTP